MSPGTPHYDEDFYAWTRHQAALLRAQKLQELDYTNLAEEIESLGNRDVRELEHRLAVLVRHLLKLAYARRPGASHRSWTSTIWTQRRNIASLLQQSPHLRPLADGTLTQRYASIIKETSMETDRPRAHFPTVCPWTVEQVLDEDFWPDA